VNRVLGKIFGPRRAVVTGDWKNLHSEELHDLSGSSVEKNETDGASEMC
jgi:hypothetical protein